MSPKILIGLGLASFALAGCGEPAHTVAVPPGEAAQVKTDPTPAKTKEGKQALNNAASVD